MHLKLDDLEIMCGPSCGIIAYISHAFGKVHISVATAGDALTVSTCRNVSRCRVLYRFYSRQCPFRTNVNRTFCPAQPTLMGHLEKLIGLCPMSARRPAPSLPAEQIFI